MAQDQHGSGGSTSCPTHKGLTKSPDWCSSRSKPPYYSTCQFSLKSDQSDPRESVRIKAFSPAHLLAGGCGPTLRKGPPAATAPPSVRCATLYTPNPPPPPDRADSTVTYYLQGKGQKLQVKLAPVKEPIQWKGAKQTTSLWKS